MSLVSSSIPNLINGVSQQPFMLRNPTQAEVQTNCLSSAVEGLVRRPGTQHKAALRTWPLGNAFSHTINRDQNEQYVVHLTDDRVHVHDLDGVERFVNTPDGVGYLEADDPKTSFKILTVADYSFVVNTEKTVEMLPDLTAGRDPEVIFYVKQGDYGRNYQVVLMPSTGTGVNVSFVTPNGSDASHSTQVDTSYIAGQLEDLLNISPIANDLEVTRYASAVHVKWKDGRDFGVAVEDGFGGKGFIAIKSKVQKFSDLPIFAPDGYMCEIIGDDDNEFDNYYVKYVKENVNDSKGYWEETVKGDIPYKIDPSTMPHVLISEANGNFTFKQQAWDERVVGDEDSAQEPSFIGKNLEDVFFFRNRLGFLADENMICSEAGSFFNFFPKTVMTQLDDAPIDIAVSHIKVSLLYHAVPFSENLLLFSGQTQFTTGGQDLFTPSTIQLNQTTEFDTNIHAKPVGLGKYVYFATDKTKWSSIREYFVDSETDINDATDITAHVPKYIPSGIFKIASAENEDTLAVLTRGDQSSVFIYRFFWNGQEKLQSSWSKWEFGEDAKILNASFIGSKLILAISRASGVYLEELDIGIGATDLNSDYNYRLDRKITDIQTTIEYNSATNITTWTMPFDYAGDIVGIVRAGNTDKGLPEGSRLKLEKVNDHTVTAKGDFRNTLVTFGQSFESRYRFSVITVKEPASNGGTTTNGSGELTVKRMNLFYADTGFFKIEVTPVGGDTSTFTFTGREVGSGKNTLGSLALETGRFPFDVGAKNEEVTVDIVSDSFLPFSFQAAEWEGDFTTQGRRI